ncbi:MAG: GGDEF domain-containing protein [Sulfuricellaceae bacterium]
MLALLEREFSDHAVRTPKQPEQEAIMLNFGNVSYKKRRAAALAISAAPQQDDALAAHLHEIIERRLLTALFQPIVDFRSGVIAGYEGLIRGPSDSPLHSPLRLAKLAQQHRLSVEVEHLSRRMVLEKFAELGLPGQLFLNVSPECLLQHNARHGETLAYLQDIGMAPERVIIELTESQASFDYGLLREASAHYRGMGFKIAMDDLGEVFLSRRTWSELRPEYVKIDMHFIQGIDHDPVKLQFVRSIQEIAEKSGCRVIAEGIETQTELLAVKGLNIAFGQGYHIARPNASPAIALSAEVAKALTPPVPANSTGARKAVCAANLLRKVPAVGPDTLNEMVYEMFNADPELHAVPVVKNRIPVGLIERRTLIDGFARPYRRELYGKKPCEKFMDTAPLVVDQNISIQELSTRIVEVEHHHLANGFIITANGHYHGMGTGHDLMREITRMQITAARYANPLTQLPGNVPIDEHIGLLLQNKVRFCVCYCDLDHFKPFNDVYGFHKGDEVIRLTAKVLAGFCDPTQDFIGHVGGDDFIILFQSPDWEERCMNILKLFGETILEFFSIEDRERNGYVTEDRQGKKIFHPLTSLSLGVVKVEPGAYTSLHEVSFAATDAKKQAKKIPGNALFVERRFQRAEDARQQTEATASKATLCPQPSDL